MAANQDTFKYFAYGSNLLRERILLNNPSAKFVCIGTLQDFKLTFDFPDVEELKTFDPWQGAAATIRPASSDSYVVGCVWEITTDQLAALDRQERFYLPMEVAVSTGSSEHITCRTYQMRQQVTGYTLPNPFYVKVMVDGARQHHFPEQYVRFIENLPVNDYKEPPPIYLDILKKVQQFREAETTKGQGKRC